MARAPLTAVGVETDPPRDSSPTLACDLALEGLDVCRRHRFPEREAAMLAQLGFSTHQLGHNADQAAAYLDEAMARAAAVGRTAGLAYAPVRGGVIARCRGDLQAARHHLTAALAILRKPKVLLGVI